MVLASISLSSVAEMALEGVGALALGATLGAVGCYSLFFLQVRKNDQNIPKIAN